MNVWLKQRSSAAFDPQRQRLLRSLSAGVFAFAGAGCPGGAVIDREGGDVPLSDGGKVIKELF